MTPAPRVVWPGGKRFAFTVFDDTDCARLDDVAPVYALLEQCGMRTTKSAWCIAGGSSGGNRGDTCEDARYRDWLLGLQRRGFEIGWHNATWDTSDRGRTLLAMERFRELFGAYPRTAANHSSNGEGIYWGEHRVSGVNRALYGVLTRFRRRGIYRGHVEGDPLFWGDVCRERIAYVRNFVFRDIDTLGRCPMMPYHDPDRPWVAAWFASTDGAVARSFIDAVDERAQDRLEASGGACIMYTHFAKGFAANGAVEPRVASLIRRLAGKNGWFAPVSQILDHLRGPGGARPIPRRSRARLERSWLLDKIFVGTT